MKMVQPKFNNASKWKPVPDEGVSAKEESRKKWSWSWFWNTIIKPLRPMLYIILHLGFTYWLFSRLLCVMTENPSYAFLNVSTHFNYSFAGLDLEPGVNYLLWISVIVLHINFLCHFIICMKILAGHNLVEAFRRSFRPNFVSKWLTCSLLQIVFSGFVLAFLRLNELPTSPLVKSLLILHTCSGLVVFSYYMDMLNMPKQSPAFTDVSVKRDNRDVKRLIFSAACKIIHLIFTVWLNVCVISLIMKTNPGPAFMNIGKRFGDLEAGVTLILWMFVLSLQLDALYHASICYNLFAGTNNQLIAFGRPMKTDHVLITLQGCFLHGFVCGVLLLHLYEIPISPHVLYLLILHAVSGFVSVCYMGMLQTAKQISTPTVGPIDKHDDDSESSDSDVTNFGDSGSDDDDDDQPTKVVTTK